MSNTYKIPVLLVIKDKETLVEAIKEAIYLVGEIPLSGDSKQILLDHDTNETGDRVFVLSALPPDIIHSSVGECIVSIGGRNRRMTDKPKKELSCYDENEVREPGYYDRKRG